MKNKLSDEKKAILIYSGELLLFAIIFAILGALKITQVLGYNEKRRIVFNYITLAGACWGIGDFIWALVSKKRRTRISFLDKILVLPLVAFMVTFDLISLINKPENEFFYVLMISIALFYVAIIYLFEAIYHYYKPIPGLLDDLTSAMEEDRKEKEAKEASKSENNTEEIK